MNENGNSYNGGSEENKEAENNDDEQLGSELSGASEDVPDEVNDPTKSANHLTFYARNYKSDVLKSKKPKVKYVF